MTAVEDRVTTVEERVETGRLKLATTVDRVIGLQEHVDMQESLDQEQSVALIRRLLQLEGSIPLIEGTDRRLQNMLGQLNEL